jgi:hypothetical protein
MCATSTKRSSEPQADAFMDFSAISPFAYAIPNPIIDEPVPPIVLVEKRLFKRYTDLLKKWSLARRRGSLTGY